MYTLSFTFTNPDDPRDINFSNIKDLDFEDVKAWLNDLITVSLKRTWLISNLTIAKLR